MKKACLWVNLWICLIFSFERNNLAEVYSRMQMIYIFVSLFVLENNNF